MSNEAKMGMMKFKTNIKCSGCVATVTPHLDEAVGENNWNVDTNHPSKILSIEGNADEAKVTEAVKKAGYNIEKL